jgi:hypothetical protein
MSLSRASEAVAAAAGNQTIACSQSVVSRSISRARK